MSIVLIFAGLLVAAMLIEPLANRLHLPFSAALVAAGFAGSELLVASGIDTGLRWYHFTDLILQVLLPVLIFEAAFKLDTPHLLRNVVPILVLAVPLLLVAILLTAALIYCGIGHPGFPWSAALLTAALLSPTDSIGIAPLCDRLGLVGRLPVILEGESLFNDATAVVLFTLLLGVATMPGEAPGVFAATLEFMRLFIGGILAGVPIGAAGALLMFLLKAAVPRALVSLSAALLSIYVAVDVLQVSAVMATLATGLLLGAANRRLNDEFTTTLWQLNAYAASALVFLLVGVTITVDMFTSQWLAMLIGVAAVLVARALVVFVLLQAAQWLCGASAFSLSDRTALFWGGLRGAARAGAVPAA